MAPELAHIPLAEIDLEDQTFVVTYRPELQTLQRSISQVGVITPVHLRRPAAQARLQIVCGAKRLHVCQQAGQTTVPALVYTAAELPALQAFLLAVYDNLGCRFLNAVEKARILWRLRAVFHYDESRLLSEFCPLLDLPPRVETLHDYCTLASLDDALQAATVAGSLPLETALWIGRQTADNRHALLAVFTGLKLNSNRARELATYVDEICQRDGSSVAALLHTLGLTDLLANTALDQPQKLERVRTALRQSRYPHLSRHEQRCKDATQRLHLPVQISLRPPPHFEGQQYQVTFSFRSPQELQHYAQRLLDAASSKAVEELLKLL